VTEPQVPTGESLRHGLPSDLIHDLRTPLNLIIGYSEMLMEQAQEQAREDFVPDLQKVLGAGKQLLALIQNSFHPNGPPRSLQISLRHSKKIQNRRNRSMSWRHFRNTNRQENQSPARHKVTC